MTVSRRGFLTLLGVAGASALLGLGGCWPQNEDRAESGPPYQRSFFCFDTMCSVSGVSSRQALDAAVERCRFFEQTLSATVEGSDVHRINTAAGKRVSVQPETSQLVQRSLHYSRVSNGLFDITIGAVSLLWDFHEHVIPSQQAIEEALGHIGYDRVQVGDGWVQLDDPLARIDLGGIAKGFIADDLIALLADAGEASACVNLGGNVKVLGSKPDGGPWVIGVRDAQAGSTDIVARVNSTGGSLVTSGLYERRFEVDGVGYWHILDPRTGYPAQSDIVSASLYSQASIDGDGYTKPLFMMEKDEALAFLGAQGMQGLLIDSDGAFAMTEGAGFELAV